MSSTISSVSSAQATAVASYKKDELSNSTKQKLEALGIDPSNVTSEAQALSLIARAEASQQQQNSGQQQGGNSSEQQLITEAKELATSVGANISGRDDLEDIISKISEKIQIMAEDPSKAKEAAAYQSQLASISARADSIESTQNNIFNAMNMISVSNKYALGL